MNNNILKSVQEPITTLCCCLVAKLCQTLRDSMGDSPPGPSVHGISKVRTLEWIAIPFSRLSSWPRDGTFISRADRWILNHWSTWEAHCYSMEMPKLVHTSLFRSSYASVLLTALVSCFFALMSFSSSTLLILNITVLVFHFPRFVFLFLCPCYFL